jgi:general secretion pathway protein K
MAGCIDTAGGSGPVGRAGGPWPVLRKERGIALLLVLWVVALLTIIAVALTGTQRTETALAGNQVDAARFRALADAAIDYAMLNLMVPPITTQGREAQDAPDPNLWAPDGTPHAWSFGGASLEVAVYNETSRIDLNQAPRDLLVRLLNAAGVPQDNVDSLADAIVDWRDPDNLRSPNGAEDSDYAAAGLPYGAKNGPFDCVEELQQVMGFTRQLYRLVAPALTVASGSPQVDQQFASPLVIAALQGITVADAETNQQQQTAGGAQGNAPAAPQGQGGPLYRIRVTFVQGAAKPTMEALVRTGGVLGVTVAAVGGGSTTNVSNSPVQVLWRRYGLPPNVESIQTPPASGS